MDCVSPPIRKFRVILIAEGIAMDISVKRMMTTINISTSVKTLVLPSSLLLTLPSALFWCARIISNILPYLYSSRLQVEPVPVFTLGLLREVPHWIEQLPGQDLAAL